MGLPGEVGQGDIAYDKTFGILFDMLQNFT